MKSTRTPLILIPGILCDATAWEHQVEELSDIADCMVADLRGHDDLAEMAGDILRTAPQRFALAGHSMGGRVALEMMRTDSERVTRLALLDTGTHPKQDGEDERRRRTIVRCLTDGMKAITSTWIPQIVHADRIHDVQLMSRLESMTLRFSPEDVARQNYAMLSRADLLPILPQIKCPVMLVCGRQDSYSPLSRHETMLKELKGAWLEVIEECGHMSIMERPEAVTACMRSWLLQSTERPLPEAEE